MNPALLIKLRPTGPWRVGPDSGARNGVDFIYHSDSLYSAVTGAMARLGRMEEWLRATAGNPDGAEVRFSSCFPLLDETALVVPPRMLWPPPTGAQAARVRWKAARFVPLGVVSALLAGNVLEEDRWCVDGVSECLLPVGRPGPFRTAMRWNAAVDRLSGASDRHSTACVEFRPGAGLWTVVSFAGEEHHARWAADVRTAFRLLADSGFGGERSRGWGRSEAPEFTEGTLPELILPPVQAQSPSPEPPAPTEADAETEVPLFPAPGPRPPAPDPGTPHWLLSLFSPAPDDAVDWERGNYGVLARGGRIESPVRSGELKKQVNMVVVVPCWWRGTRCGARRRTWRRMISPTPSTGPVSPYPSRSRGR
jgi:CRISPR type III-A-associated RAMP protein Csm4